ncbi:helix-turn-helix transcriptional regulator [Saccharibacillus sp. CPCC 101409]|uniref:helix-turn-helix domain-containing protein n=1 Tax=Saccharibacillus sp. CPCC 101409 TaxID=3058041 RepID=UPI002672B5FD|nr:helix-turn-helix transcriptional regulator [Saccharibacillus sp. CPCC 101409]MDO3411486.1 helix-turn-helix transcriptional regulator [Saccharibacillus sp. CPCC 101409]
MEDFIRMVGEQIRKHRKLRGLTQERLAEMSGLSFSYVSDVERGTRNISLESLGKLVYALSIKPAQLFEDVNERMSADEESRLKLESLHSLLVDRTPEEIEFILSTSREFLKTIDRSRS